MFQSITPVCPVTDMERTVAFWKTLGFEVYFTDNSAPDAAAYCGVRRGNLAIHLQAFTPEQLNTTQTMALRIWMTSRDHLDALASEWSAHDVISAPLGDKPWGNREFGIYDPDKTPFFFCVDA